LGQEAYSRRVNDLMVKNGACLKALVLPVDQMLLYFCPRAKTAQLIFPLKLYHILGLRTSVAFHNFEFDFLAFFQGTKTIPGNIAVMDKDVSAVFLGNKSISLGIAEPFNFASYSHEIWPPMIYLLLGRVRAGKHERKQPQAFPSGKGFKGLLICCLPNFITYFQLVKLLVTPSRRLSPKAEQNLAEEQGNRPRLLAGRLPGPRF
jgi:hypothetical protein